MKISSNLTIKMQVFQNLRQRTWELLEIAQPGDRVSEVVDIMILILIFLNVLAVILSTVKELESRFAAEFHAFEVFSVIVFSIEYLGRLWSCVTCVNYSKPIKGRLWFMLQPLSAIDLLAILPFYFSLAVVDLRFVRIIRLLRIFRVAKLWRYSASLRLLGHTITNKKEELIVTLLLMALLIVIASSLMYFAENEAQPERFPDIPTAMWWSVITLTTVGYGDIYPITALGKFFAGIIAIFGVGMVALPTGILGASFVEELKKQREGQKICPHCGKKLE